MAQWDNQLDSMLDDLHATVQNTSYQEKQVKLVSNRVPVFLTKFIGPYSAPGTRNFTGDPKHFILCL